MAAMTPADFAFCDNIARNTAHRYHRNWQWSNLDDLVQAAWAAIADAWRRADNADTLTGFLYTAASRAVRSELSAQRLPVSGRKGYPASTAHMHRDDHASAWLFDDGRSEDGKISTNPIMAVNYAAGLDGKNNPALSAEHEWERATARSIVEAAVQRSLSPTRAARVHPAVIAVLSGECEEVCDAAELYNIDAKLLSWAVRRVRAAIKTDAQVRRFVGKDK